MSWTLAVGLVWVAGLAASFKTISRRVWAEMEPLTNEDSGVDTALLGLMILVFTLMWPLMLLMWAVGSVAKEVHRDQ